MKCSNCNHEIEGNVKFCQNCGSKVTTDDNGVNATDSSFWIIFIGPILYIILYVKYWSDINTTLKYAIAEGTGGALVLLFVPLTITSIVFLIRRMQGSTYRDFVMHTFIGTTIMTILASWVVINDIKGLQEKALSLYRQGLKEEALYMSIKGCNHRNADACDFASREYDKMGNNTKSLYYIRKSIEFH